MNHEFWYLSRAAGFTAYVLLFVSVALGISIGTRLTERLAKRITIFDMHRFTTILALAFTLFHVYVLLGDGYFNFNVWQLSIPFLSPYRGWQTAAGVLLADVTALNGVDNLTGILLTRGPSIIKDAGIVWFAGMTTNQKATATASLLALGIVTRKAV